MANGTAKITINTVFVVSMACAAGIGIWGLIDPDSMTGTMLGFTNYMLTGVSWAWLFICSGFLFLSIFLAFGPYGHIRLGADDEEPEFSTALVDRHAIRRGHGLGPACSGARPSRCITISARLVWRARTPAAARQALVITNLHWGFHAWAIYAVLRPGDRLFHLPQGTASSMISTPIKALFGGQAGEGAGKVADILAVLSVVFGLGRLAGHGHLGGALGFLLRLRHRRNRHHRPDHPGDPLRLLHAVGDDRRRQGHQDPVERQHGGRDPDHAAGAVRRPDALPAGDLHRFDRLLLQRG